MTEVYAIGQRCMSPSSTFAHDITHTDLKCFVTIVNPLSLPLPHFHPAIPSHTHWRSLLIFPLVSNKQHYLSHTHTLSVYLSHTHSLSLSLFHTHTNTHTLSHTLSHTHSLSLTHTISLYISLSLSLSLGFRGLADDSVSTPRRAHWLNSGRLIENWQCTHAEDLRISHEQMSERSCTTLVCREDSQLHSKCPNTHIAPAQGQVNSI